MIQPNDNTAVEGAESWSGNPHGLAKELRRVANVFGTKFRIVQLLRDAADEIETLTTNAPAADSVAGEREAIEAAIPPAQCGDNSRIPAQAGEDGLRAALTSIKDDFESDFVLDGVIVDDPDDLLVLNYRRAVAALNAEAGK